MPCYSRITSEVKFGEKTDIRLLAKAFEALGLSVTRENEKALSATTVISFRGQLAGQYVTGTYQSGDLKVQASAPVEMNMFKRAYSAEVVKASAQRFGWTVKQSGDNQFHVQRRF